MDLLIRGQGTRFLPGQGWGEEGRQQGALSAAPSWTCGAWVAPVAGAHLCRLLHLSRASGWRGWTGQVLDAVRSAASVGSGTAQNIKGSQGPERSPRPTRGHPSGGKPGNSCSTVTAAQQEGPQFRSRPDLGLPREVAGAAPLCSVQATASRPRLDGGGVRSRQPWKTSLLSLAGARSAPTSRPGSFPVLGQPEGDPDGWEWGGDTRRVQPHLPLPLHGCSGWRGAWRGGSLAVWMPSSGWPCGPWLAGDRHLPALWGMSWRQKRCVGPSGFPLQLPVPTPPSVSLLFERRGKGFKG